MKKALFILITMAMISRGMVLPVIAEQNTTYIHVAVDGSAANSGATANTAVTIEKANELVSQSVNNNKPVTVYFHEGEYSVSDTIALNTGSENALVTYQAYEGAEVIFTGSKTLDATRLSGVTDAAMKAKIPAGAQEAVLCMDISDFDIGVHSNGYYGSAGTAYNELFVNDSGQVLARYPNISGDLYEYLSVSTGKYGNEYTTVDEQKKVTAAWYDVSEWANAAEKVALWKQANDYQQIRLHGYTKYEWAYGRTYVESIDTETSKISIYPSGGTEVGSYNRFYIADLLEELDAPGEWFIDRTEKILYFYPPQGFDKTGDRLELSQLSAAMIDIENCKYLKLQGITFKNMRGRAVLASNTDNVTIDNCTFQNIGHDAIYADIATNFTLSNSTIENTGARGIFITGGDSDTLTKAENYVINNTFIKNGQISRAYHGAVVVRGCGAIVANNTMKNTPHQMIGYTGTYIRILNNDIERACTEAGDMGAIYSGRNVIFRGNEIAYNYIHDIVSISDYPMMAIYLDDNLTGQHIHHNIIKNVDNAVHDARSIFVNGGSDTSVHDNIVVDSVNGIYIGDAVDEERYKEIWKAGLDYIANKPQYLERFPTMKYLDPTLTWAHGNFVYDNLVVNSGCQVYEYRFKNAKFNEGGRSNRRENNTVTDSFLGFVDAENGNYEIKAGDSILTTHPGLADIKTDKIGRQATETKVYPDSYTPKLQSEVEDKVFSMNDYISYGDYRYIDTIEEYLSKAEVNNINVDYLRASDEYKRALEARDNYYSFAKQSEYAELGKKYNTDKPEIEDEELTSYGVSFSLTGKAINNGWSDENIWTDINTENKRYASLELLATNDACIKLVYKDGKEVIKNLISVESVGTVERGGKTLTHYSIPLDRTRKLSGFSILKNGYQAEYDEYGEIVTSVKPASGEIIYKPITLNYNITHIFNNDVTNNGGLAYGGGSGGSIYAAKFKENTDILWKTPWTDEMKKNTLTANGVDFNIKVVAGKTENVGFMSTAAMCDTDGKWATIDVEDMAYESIDFLINVTSDGTKWGTTSIRLNYTDGTSEISEYKNINKLNAAAPADAVGGISVDARIMGVDKKGTIAHYSVPADNEKILDNVQVLGYHYDIDGFNPDGTVTSYTNIDSSKGQGTNSALFYAMTGVTRATEETSESDIYAISLTLLPENQAEESIIDLSAYYNLDNIYSDNLEATGGSASGEGNGSYIYYSDFIADENWKYFWTAGETDNVYVAQDVDFKIRLSDDTTAKTVVSSKHFDGEWLDISLTPAKYDSIEALVASAFTTDAYKHIQFKLNYSDGSVLTKEYQLNNLIRTFSGDTVAGGGIELKITYPDDGDPATEYIKKSGRLSHISIPTDADRVLQSISILSANYTAQDIDGEIVTTKQYSLSQSNKIATSVYAMTGIKNLAKQTGYLKESSLEAVEKAISAINTPITLASEKEINEVEKNIALAVADNVLTTQNIANYQEFSEYLDALNNLKRENAKFELSNIKLYNKNGESLTSFYSGGNYVRVTADINSFGRVDADIYMALYDGDKLKAVKVIEPAEKLDESFDLDENMNENWKLIYFAWKKGVMIPYGEKVPIN